MRKRILAAAILLVAVAAALIHFASPQFFGTPKNPAPPIVAAKTENISNDSNHPAKAVAVNVPTENLAAKAGELPPPAPVATNIPPLIILQNARQAIVQYAQVYGGNPVGTNPEITAALMGNNPKHINFITPDSGLQVNDQGEMLDAWGMPLFFHQLSAHDMEIRSAGEDRKLWTFDDLIIH
jgi:hypothetical protein